MPLSDMERRYDTYEIRRAAKQVMNVAQSVNEVQTNDLTRILNELNGSFEGDAADALKELIGYLRSDIHTLANELGGISNGLERYAVKLEETDRALTAIISKSL